jgi:hypothetical protein
MDARNLPYVDSRSILDKTLTCGISSCIMARNASRTTEMNFDASVM